jgi:iron-sulfur cluster assembly accessory protein
MKLTQSAERQLARITDEVGAVGVKLSLIRTGCNGYGYKLDLVNEPNTNDFKAFSFDTVNVYLSNQDVMFLADVEVDYVAENLGYSFKFRNPLEEAVCGCGKSFYMK